MANPECEDCECEMEYDLDNGWWKCKLCGQTSNSKSDGKHCDYIG